MEVSPPACRTCIVPHDNLAVRLKLGCLESSGEEDNALTLVFPQAKSGYINETRSETCWYKKAYKNSPKTGCLYSLEAGSTEKIYGQFAGVIDHVHSKASLPTIAYTPVLALTERSDVCLKKAKVQHTSTTWCTFLLVGTSPRHLGIMSLPSVALTIFTSNHQLSMTHILWVFCTVVEGLGIRHKVCGWKF